MDKGQIYSYATNYSGFLEGKTLREDILDAQERKRQSILRVELEWVKRGARARSTKQKARLERYEEMKGKSAPVKDAQVEIGSVSSRLGRTTVELDHIEKSFDGKTIIHDFTYHFLKDDRIGIVGRNGCGKSTLLKLMQGILEPDSGSVVIGPTVKLGYFAQEIQLGKDMDPNQRVIDYIRDVAEYVETDEGKITAARLLERFLFRGEDQYGLIGKLSGGERRRLYLCKVLMSAPNVLILDEPTNDLDITTLTILEDYLDSFQGIVVAVSHDRYFLDRVVRRIFAFRPDGTLWQSEGGYTDYETQVLYEQQAAEKSAGAKQKRMILNTFIVWLLTGLWHGADWNFIIWGMFFLVLLTVEKLFLLDKLEPHAILSHIYMLIVTESCEHLYPSSLTSRTSGSFFLLLRDPARRSAWQCGRRHVLQHSFLLQSVFHGYLR